jgi:hypothetical protein
MKPLPEKSIVMKALQNMFTEQHSGKPSPRQFYYSTGGLMRDYPEQFNSGSSNEDTGRERREVGVNPIPPAKQEKKRPPHTPSKDIYIYTTIKENENE